MQLTRRNAIEAGLAVLVRPLGAAGPALEIDCAFPGGNIILDAVEGDAVHLHQDLRDTNRDWFYWCFRVRGAAGRTLLFRFTRSTAIGLRGPAVSTDAGRTWSWLGLEDETRKSFRYSVPPGAAEVRFCVTLPYLESHWRAFAARHASNPAFRQSVLCTSQKGRPVQLAEIGRLTKNNLRVLLTARHHACESIASFELEGFLEQVLADDSTGRWLRTHVHFTVVPFMDKDGVEDGDQGKNRRPRDHNRDYAGESIHPSVAALRKLVHAWPEGQLRIHIDMHCPNLPDREIYFVGVPDQRVWKEAEALSRILESVQAGSLRFDSRNNLPFGKSWNSATNFTDGKSSTTWTSEQPGIWLASTIELPYANAGGAVVTPDSARAFGRDVATALRQYVDQKLTAQG